MLVLLYQTFIVLVRSVFTKMHRHLNVWLYHNQSNVAAATGESIAVAGLPNLHEVSLPVLREILCDKFEVF